MSYILSFIALILLFFALGVAADYLVRAVKKLAHDFRVPAIFSGIILGLFTSTPEFFVGITSSIQGVGALSYGNLIGGIIVLFGLVVPINAFMNRGVALPASFTGSQLGWSVGCLFLPLLVAWDGTVSLLDGIFLIICYLVLTYGISRHELVNTRFKIFIHSTHGKEYLTVIVGTVVILLASHFIVTIGSALANSLGVPLFLVGLLVFGIGTNLPELSIALRSLKNRTSEIALGNVLGSAMANIFIAGMIAVMRPVAIATGAAFVILLFFYAVLCILFILMTLTGRRLTRREGVALLAGHILFLTAQIFYQFNQSP